MPIRSDTVDSWDEDPEFQRRFEELKGQQEEPKPFDIEEFWDEFYGDDREEWDDNESYEMWDEPG